MSTLIAIFLLCFNPFADAETTGSGSATTSSGSGETLEGSGVWVDVYVGGQKDREEFIRLDGDRIEGDNVLLLLPSEPSKEVRNRNPKSTGLQLGNANVAASAQSTFTGSLVKFMKDWARACPGDSTPRRGEEPKSNKVTIVDEHQLNKMGFSKSLEQYQPDVLVFQVRHRNKPFNLQKWRSFLKMIPAKKKCLILGPRYSRNFAADKAYTEQLSNLLNETRHHCRLVSALDEMHNHKSAKKRCKRFFNRSGELTPCAQNLRSKEAISQICDRELRMADTK